jgi:hypothetical protein
MNFATFIRPITVGVLLAIALQVLDLVSFQLAVTKFGTWAESNLIMRGLYESLGFAGVLMVKLGLVAYLILSLPLLTSLRTLAIVSVGTIGLIGSATNILAYILY